MRFQWALRDFAPSMLYISLQVVLAPYRHPRARVTHRLLFPIIVVPHRPCVLYLSTYLPSTLYFLLCRPSSLRFTPHALTTDDDFDKHTVSVREARAWLHAAILLSVTDLDQVTTSLSPSSATFLTTMTYILRLFSQSPGQDLDLTRA